MPKPLKRKKDKVPKLTEAEYVQYISALKGEDGARGQIQPRPATQEMKIDERHQP